MAETLAQMATQQVTYRQLVLTWPMGLWAGLRKLEREERAT
jgi:hypothetical protein